MNQVLLAISIMAVPCVQAAEWSLTSKLNPSMEYDDNTYMSEDNKESSMRYAVTPTATIARADENSNISINLGYRLERWSSVDIEDSEDPFATLNSTFNTERSQFGLDLAYAETQTRDDAAEDTGNFRNNSTQTTRRIAPSYSYQLTELDVVSVNSSYTDNDYDDIGSNDNELKMLTTDWMHQYTERFSGGISLGVDNYKADSTLTSFSIDHDNYNVSALLNYQFSELWSVDGRIGYRRLESELTNDFGFKEDNTNTGSSFDFNATRQDDIETLNLSASNTLSPNSNGGVDEQKRLAVDWSTSLSDTLTASINSYYLQETSAVLESSDKKRKYFQLSPSIRWQFQKNLGLNLSYRYRRQKREILDTDATGNSVMATLIYDWDGIRASR